MIINYNLTNMEYQTIAEEMINITNHLYWYYNADMADLENQKDFKESLKKLEELIKEYVSQYP